MKRKIYIIIFVIAILLATATGIFEHYRLNQDHLIQYFPENSVVYLHARLHTDQIIANDFDIFLNKRPELLNTIYPRLQEHLNIWPKFDPMKVEEVSMGIVSHNDDFIPVLGVVVNKENSIHDVRKDWDKQGLYVKQNDRILIVSSYEDYFDNQKSLQSVFETKRFPTSNAWYGYVDMMNSQEWFKKQTNYNEISGIFEKIATNQQELFASVTFRNDFLIVTEDVRRLRQIDRYVYDWKLRLLGGNVFVFHDILYSSEFLNKIVKFFNRFDPNIRKGPGIVERFDIENFIIEDLLEESGLSDSIDGIILSDDNSIIELKKIKDFDKEVFFDFIKQIASYDYPSQKSTKLKDGTYITELVAQDEGQISINQLKQDYGNMFIVVSGSDEWKYYFAETENSMFVLTDKNLSDLIFTKSEYSLDKSKQICFFGQESYIYDSLQPKLVDWGKNYEYIINFKPGAITFCLR